MLMYNDSFSWPGWGGRLRLGSGRCRLWIYDRQNGSPRGVAHLKPIIVMVADDAQSSMSVRSCAAHIATTASRQFRLDPHRMVYVEFYPADAYGEKKQHIIPEKYEAVEFNWHGDKALKPQWHKLPSEMLKELKTLLKDHPLKGDLAGR